PAAAAGSAHGEAVATVGAQAREQIATVASDTSGRQQEAVTAADAEVGGLHEAWSTEKAGIVEQHRTAIAQDAGQTRAEAARTMADADQQAKAEAEKSDSGGGGGLWDRIKSAGSAVAGAVKGLASAVAAGVTRILNAARERVNGMLDRLVNAVKERVGGALRAIADGARRVAGAITTAIGKARDLVTRLARAARDLAGRLWQAAAERLNRLWQALKAAARAAVAAATALVRKVGAALALVRDILKLLNNKLLAFIMEVLQDPQGKVVAPVVAKAEPLAGGVPAKADELAHQSVAQEPAGGAAAQRMVVQRAPVQADPPVPGEGFWGGVGRHLSAAGRNFTQNWAAILGKVVLDVLTWIPMLVDEGPKLWNEIKMTWTGGGGLDRLDHALQALRHLVSIVGGTLATIGVWALIIAWLGGPVAEGAALAAYEGVSWAVIGADLTLALVELSKYAYSATRPGIDPEVREQYLSMFASSGIAAAVTLVLIALGLLAARLAKALKLRRAAAAAGAAGKEKAPPPPVKDDRPPAPPTTDKPSVRFGRPEDGYHPDRIFMDYINHDIPSEGWKLHVSADAASAPAVADAVLPRLRQMGVNHKVVGSLEALEGMSGTQQAKFITIYPDNAAQAKQIVAAVDSAVSGVSGGAPAVGGELPVGSSGRVYTRYGGFTKSTVTGPGGVEVPDRRGQVCPPWVDNPWTGQPAQNPTPVGPPGGRGQQ
ncbi:MAG TPA: hypothetical protein VJT31_18275, partial [Rugosimonospora sp.]|nr:hypothetical protein [Rugosimonospora sp.]